MHPIMQRLLSEATTRRQATALARILTRDLRTWRDAGDACGRLWIQEMLPPDQTPDDPIDDDSLVRERIANVLAADWARRTQAAILEECLDNAASRLAAEWSKAQITIATRRENALHAFYYHLQAKLGFSS